MDNQKVISLLRSTMSNLASSLSNEEQEAFEIAIKTINERKHGHWIKTDWGEYQCSVCNNCEETMSEEFNEDLYFNEADFMERNKFCRQCGAIMDE